MEEGARLILRIIIRKAETEAAKEDEQERQIVENGERLLNLTIISNDSEQEGDI